VSIEGGAVKDSGGINVSAPTEPARPSSRCHWLSSAGLIGAAAILSARAGWAQAKKTADEEEEIAPPEDLMREHGVLNRVLLIYDEAVRRIDATQDLPPNSLGAAATIIRSFIEDYHEKLEEDYLFPRFEKAGRLTDLTHVLRAQHQAGRRLTDQVMQFASLQALKDPGRAETLKRTLQQFLRMYRPHEAREDTVLFPALRHIVSKQESGALGEDFEKMEHNLFGEDGYEKMVDRVATIEKSLGIYDLAQYTPRA
jgi:hemerythrin-like domain-containing protein